MEGASATSADPGVDVLQLHFAKVVLDFFRPKYLAGTSVFWQLQIARVPREGSSPIALSCSLRVLRGESPIWRIAEKRRTDQDARTVVSDFGNPAGATRRSRNAARDSEATLAERHHCRI